MSAGDIKAQESIANRFGYGKVSQMKLAVAKAIKDVDKSVVSEGLVKL
jgi:hypothetical protein